MFSIRFVVDVWHKLPWITRESTRTPSAVFALWEDYCQTCDKMGINTTLAPMHASGLQS